MKLTAKEKLLFIVPCCLLALPWLLLNRWGNAALLRAELPGDGMDRAMQLAAGSGAVACGHVRVGGSQFAAAACSVAVFQRHQPF